MQRKNKDEQLKQQAREEQKKMKINISNTEKIQAALNETQNKCRERCYTAKNLQNIAEDFTKHLMKLGVPRAKLNGCILEFGGNYKPAKAYKYAFVGTMGKITFSASGAFLTTLERTYCNCHTRATLTNAAKEAIIKNAENHSY